MVTMLVYPPPLNPPKGIAEFSPEELQRIESLTGELGSLLMPMARVAARETLDDLIRSNTSRFLTLKREMVELLWPVLSDPAQARQLYEYMRTLCELKTDLLGEDNSRLLVAMIDSAEGLNEWASALVRQGGPTAYRLESIQNQAGGFMLAVDMCLNTLMLVFLDQLKNWEPGSLGILLSAADEHMTEVEDAFLASTGVGDSSEETVSYSALRKELGI